MLNSIKIFLLSFVAIVSGLFGVNNKTIGEYAPTRGMTNPMTTAGDMIIGATAGTPTKLGIGSNGQVLTVSSGTPIWAPSTGSGGSSATTTINGASGPDFSFLTGTSGSNFNLATSTGSVTFNLPTASASNRGLLSSADWTTFNNKQPAGSYLTSISGLNISTLNNDSGFITSSSLTQYLSTTTAASTYAPLTSPTFATSINGSYLTASQILGTDASKNIVSLPVATYPSLTELTYLKGVTSAIQTQLNGKQASLTNPVTGTGTTNELAYWSSSSAIGTLPVATYPSLTELSYIKGVTSAIQTQLNAKGTFTLPDLTTGSVLFSNGTTISQDNNNFFYDSTNNRLAVGTKTFLSTGNVFQGVASSTATAQLNIQNTSSGTSASSDLVATADTGTDSANYIDLGINSSTYNDAGYTIGGALSSYLYSNGGDLAVGTQSTGKVLKFHTGGTLAANLRATISDTGLAVVGTVTGSNLSGTNTGNESTSTIGVLINGSTSTTTPADTDRFAFSSTSILRYITWSNIKSSLKTYFDTVYSQLAGSISQAFSALSLDLGNADTTIARVSAGVISVEGVTVPTISSTDTLTNKRVTPRIVTTATTTSLTINSDTTDQYTITALASALTINAPSGTPTDGQKLVLRITPDATPRALTFATSTGGFATSSDLALPSTTVASKTMYLGFIWSSLTSRWNLIAFLNNF